ncbi:hypothetical protein PAMC26577_01795 [Caballeronia sordidicola]|uniref:Uncharacterized protein n=1 Tax=Caballeronia sordidicola TaxID=196367 RepID=A0A242N7R4_CABSO|nr:hypothetical protein PAMC26577_01795 [Caballeronia sordidicola]
MLCRMGARRQAGSLGIATAYYAVVLLDVSLSGACGIDL